MEKVEMVSEGLLDRVLKIASGVQARGEVLWSWYVFGVILFTGISLLIQFNGIKDIYFLGLDPMFKTEMLAFTLMQAFSMVVQLSSIVIVIAMRKRIRSHDSSGINLAGISMILNIVSGGVLIFFFGVYAFSNKKFRDMVGPFAPSWYKTYSEFLDEISR